MSHEQIIANKISELFDASPWEGVIPREEAIAQTLEYRSNLSLTDRELYDELILQGIHPSRIEEMIELASGRLASRTSRNPELAKV